ncbi:Uncharacterised protein [Bacillus freudenreichii]|nr:Uncharacterised protein [Bacillus freudenreichii]
MKLSGLYLHHNDTEQIIAEVRHGQKATSRSLGIAARALKQVKQGRKRRNF